MRSKTEEGMENHYSHLLDPFPSSPFSSLFLTSYPSRPSSSSRTQSPALAPANTFSTTMSTSDSSEEEEEEEEEEEKCHLIHDGCISKRRLPNLDKKEEEEEEECPPPPPSWFKGGGNSKKRLSKQMSLRDSTREAAWEKRREQVMRRRREMEAAIKEKEEEEEQDGHQRRKRRNKSLTDEDLDELKGFMDLGFKFNEEGHHDLCNTLPALNLYFAVNRYYSGHSPVSTPTTTVAGVSLPSLKESPRSPIRHDRTDTWNIFHPGDDPQHIKTRLRHWAQAVAFSLRQFG